VRVKNPLCWPAGVYVAEPSLFVTAKDSLCSFRFFRLIMRTLERGMFVDFTVMTVFRLFFNFSIDAFSRVRRVPCCSVEIANNYYQRVNIVNASI